MVSLLIREWLLGCIAGLRVLPKWRIPPPNRRKSSSSSRPSHRNRRLFYNPMALFGSSGPFGASTPSPFGGVSPTSNPFGTTPPSSPFGASQNTSSIFGAKPFGSSTFVAQTGSSLFGGTATGVFGATQASPSASSTPVFGASSTPAFGSTPSAFGSGTSVFGQKPAAAFGGFGSTSVQPNPFGSTTFGQSQPAFGSPSFGSSAPAFGSSTPAFGSTPFGANSTPAFGATSTPAFGATSTPAFGANSAPAFGVSSAPAFGASSTPAFSATASSIFGSTTPTFGQSTPAFGSSSTPAFGSTSVFGSGGGTTSFGAQSTPAFGSSPSFGSSMFNASPFGGQRNGSRAAPYAPTSDAEAGVTGQTGKLMSISAMPALKNKSSEELRWEDYQAGDKGGPSPAGQQPATGMFGQASPSTPFAGTSSAFSQTPAPNPFGAGTPSNFGTKPAGTFGTPSTGAVTMPSSSPFGAPSSGSAFGQASTPSFGLGLSSPFGAGSTPSFAAGFGSSPSMFGSPAAPAFSSASPNLFSAGTTAFGSNPFTQGATSSSLFPTANQPFSMTIPAFSTPGLGSSIFGSSGSPFQNTKPAGLSVPGSSMFGGLSSTPGQATGSFGFSSLGQSQSVLGSFGAPATPGMGLSMFTPQPSAPVAVSNPFGSLPPMPQMSIGHSAATGPSIQYGISSIPIFEKPTQVRTTSILTPRHITQRSRIRMPPRGYHPKKDVPRVSFFHEVEDTPSTSKGDALFVPRENPRALFIRRPDQSLGTLRSTTLKSRDMAASMKQNDEKLDGNGMVDVSSSPLRDKENPWGHADPLEGHTSAAFGGTKEGVSLQQSKVEEENPLSKGAFLKQNSTHGGEAGHRGNGYISVTGHRAGKAAVAYEHGADIEALMPKLRHSDYYIQPKVQELAAKERAELGYCRRVKDFVVGRQGYGSVKFLGETDVRGLDLESIVQFNKCEVLVYMDEHRKPLPGFGLNKPAEITLLNVKCVDKKSGHHLSEGVEAEKFEKRLKKKTEEQGAEFVSYDASTGEWKFRVKHFSKYSFIDV